MSHLIPVKIEGNKFDNQEFLIKALENIGFSVNSYNTPQWFRNYYGELQNRAEVVLKRNENPPIYLSSDAGFLKNPDTGIYQLIADSMDAEKFKKLNLSKEYLKVKVESKANEIAAKMNRGKAIVQWLDEDTYAIQFTQDLNLSAISY